MESHINVETDHDNTLQDASYPPHDRSAFTYPSSYTDYGTRPHGQQHNVSYVDPASQSYIFVPRIKVVEVEPGVQMFPSHPRVAFSLSVAFTFLCCFVCSIPAIVLSSKAWSHEREGEKRLAARLANQIAFFMILSVVFGIIFWVSLAMLNYAYRFQ
ncbi:uncharacterized protein LOC143285873 isoform X2 [Babylonia areolata]|uniref:uncharacterized protein LOC143285873 isoform X2 n=1 Tax=Babylonia areolata TaxID=304850 RepID=UPI003FD59C7C